MQPVVSREVVLAISSLGDCRLEPEGGISGHKIDIKYRGAGEESKSDYSHPR